MGMIDWKMHKQTVYNQLQEEYVIIWNSIWLYIESVPCGISIDDTVADRFFDVPLLFTRFLLQAILLGSIEATKLMLQRHPNVHAKNGEGKTAFFFAAEHHHFKILRLLLESTTEMPQFYFGDTSLLHLLCIETWQRHPDAKYDQISVVIELLRRGHRPDYNQGRGKSPIQLADEHGLYEISNELKIFQGRYH